MARTVDAQHVDTEEKQDEEGTGVGVGGELRRGRGRELGAEKRRSGEDMWGLRSCRVSQWELWVFRKGQIIFLGKIFLILSYQFGYLVIKQ